MITKGQDRCLNTYPLAEFERISAGLRTGAVALKAMRDYSRVFFASTSDEILDRQGWITILPPLRDYAGLTRDCVVNGRNTHVEVWDAARWADLESTEESFAELREEDLPGLL